MVFAFSRVFILSLGLACDHDSDQTLPGAWQAAATSAGVILPMRANELLIGASSVIVPGPDTDWSPRGASGRISIEGGIFGLVVLPPCPECQQFALLCAPSQQVDLLLISGKPSVEMIRSNQTAKHKINKVLPSGAPLVIAPIPSLKPCWRRGTL